MTANQIYVRLLTETHYSVGRRSTAVTRMHIQDVLNGLLVLAVKETGGTSQGVQDAAELAASASAREIYDKRRSGTGNNPAVGMSGAYD